jgi:hypothetical protein
MPATQTSKKFAALTANGTTGGLITIGSNVGWLPGALAWLDSSGQDPVEVKIVEQVGTTQLRLRRTDAAGQARGAASDVSAFTTAQNATIAMAQQVVAVDAPYTPVEKA